ncbi:MAG: STN domain-containing protein [Geovibrio sp.]|nr:STN domain-containing protein [Geovibrio sp.]
MDCRKLLTVMFTMIFIFACSAKKPEPPAAQTEEPAKSEQKEVRLPPPPPPVFGGELKKPDPLEGRYITVSAVEAPLSSILYMAAAESGMNLVISPEIDINRPVTLNLNRLPAREALNIITETAGIYFETDGNILRIRPLTAKTYKIPYVHTVTAYSSRLGGDIIGGAAEKRRYYGRFIQPRIHQPRRTERPVQADNRRGAQHHFPRQEHRLRQ